MSFLSQYDTKPDLNQVIEWILTQGTDFFKELREERPVFKTEGPIILSKFKDVDEVLNRETVFSTRLYVDKMDPTVGPYFLARDADIVNERDKAIMSALVSRNDLPDIKNLASKLVSENIAQGSKAGSLEIVNNLSRKLPIQLCDKYFGIPGPNFETMAKWSATMNWDMFYNLDNDQEIHNNSLNSAHEMRAYLDYLIIQKLDDLESNPNLDDVLARLLKANYSEKIGFDKERIRANIMFMLVGGVETVSTSVVNALDVLLDRPEQLEGAQEALARHDDAFFNAYIWEAVRFKPIVPFLVRYCESNYIVAKGTEREQIIPQGSVVFASVASAMHDEDALPHPDQFLLDRPDYLNMNFGYGYHSCLCYHLGLLETAEILKGVLRLKGLRRADGPSGRIDNKGGPFPEQFSVQFDN